MNTKLPEVTVLSKCRANLTFVYTKHVTLQTDGRTEGQTDGRTDRFAISISRVSMLTRDKKH